MKNKPCIIIHCIAFDSATIETDIFKALDPLILKSFPQAAVSLERSEIYWKFPECKSIMYGIYYPIRMLVPELIQIFPVTWTYKERGAHLVETGERYLDQDAIWNKDCHQEEMFVHPAIEWVHIYTWPDTAPCLKTFRGDDGE